MSAGLRRAPPFQESEAGVHLGAIRACESVEYYADFARTIEDQPDGTWVEIVVKKYAGVAAVSRPGGHH